MSKKEKGEGLDAAFIISQAKRRNRELHPYSPESEQEEKQEDVSVDITASTPSAAPREDTRRKKSKMQSYESLFIRDSPISTRSGKGVHIRKEFHDRIMRIVQVIGYNEVSLFSYLDNVLEHHFNTFQEDISELYKERTPDIF